MSAPSSASMPSASAPQHEWTDILRATAVETFATMVGATLVAPPDGEVRVLDEVTGMVGIAGAIRAIFSLHCSLQTATKLSSHMPGVPLQDAADQKAAAVGEICNVIAGYFMAKIGVRGLCSLSVPSVLSGTNYKIHSPGKTIHLGLPLMYEEEIIWVGLDIKI